MRKKSGIGNIVRLQLRQQLFTRKLAVACAAVLIVCLRVFSPLVRFAQANGVSVSPLGTGLGILLALEDAFFLNALWAKYMWLSPSTMSRLYMLEKVREYAAPTPWEAMALMGGAILALALAARWMGPRRLEA